MSLIFFSSAPILIPERICDSYLFKYFVVREISMNIWPVMECHDNSRLTQCNISKTTSYRLCCQVLPNIMFCIRKLIACLAILIRRIHFRIFIPKAPSNIFYRYSIGHPCCENGYMTSPHVMNWRWWYTCCYLSVNHEKYPVLHWQLFGHNRPTSQSVNHETYPILHSQLLGHNRPTSHWYS